MCQRSIDIRNSDANSNWEQSFYQHIHVTEITFPSVSFILEFYVSRLLQSNDLVSLFKASIESLTFSMIQKCRS